MNLSYELSYAYFYLKFDRSSLLHTYSKSSKNYLSKISLPLSGGITLVKIQLYKL